jgi:hypothetical protein
MELTVSLNRKKSILAFKKVAKRIRYGINFWIRLHFGRRRNKEGYSKWLKGKW